MVSVLSIKLPVLVRPSCQVGRRLAQGSNRIRAQCYSQLPGFATCNHSGDYQNKTCANCATQEVWLSHRKSSTRISIYVLRALPLIFSARLIITLCSAVLSHFPGAVCATHILPSIPCNLDFADLCSDDWLCSLLHGNWHWQLDPVTRWLSNCNCLQVELQVISDRLFGTWVRSNMK